MFYLTIWFQSGIRSCAPMFYLTVWFQRERFEVLPAVNTMEHVLASWCWRRMSWKAVSKE
jgi:hypothetical protein